MNYTNHARRFAEQREGERWHPIQINLEIQTDPESEIKFSNVEWLWYIRWFSFFFGNARCPTLIALAIGVSSPVCIPFVSHFFSLMRRCDEHTHTHQTVTQTINVFNVHLRIFWVMFSAVKCSFVQSFISHWQCSPLLRRRTHTTCRRDRCQCKARSHLRWLLLLHGITFISETMAYLNNAKRWAIEKCNALMFRAAQVRVSHRLPATLLLPTVCVVDLHFTMLQVTCIRSYSQMQMPCARRAKWNCIKSREMSNAMAMRRRRVYTIISL